MKKILYKIKILLLILIPISLVFSIKLNSILIIALIIISLKEIFDSRSEISIHKIQFISLIGFVITVFIGLFIDFFYDVKIENGIYERIAPFIVFPIFFLTHTKFLKEKLLIHIFSIFSVIITIISVALWLIMFYNYFHDNSILKFERELFLKPLLIHPTYISIYISLSLLFFLNNILENKIKFTDYLFSAINILTLLAVGSKAGIIMLILILLSWIVILFLRKKITLVTGIIIITVPIILIIITPSINQRFNQAFKTLIENKYQKLSTSDRLKNWEILQTVQKKDLLIGLGNNYGQEVFNNLGGINFNLHNQYFQALFNSGLLGLLCLLVFIFGPLFFLKKNFIIITFITIVSFNLLFENLLDRQWGIVFIAYFYSFFHVMYINNES